MYSPTTERYREGRTYAWTGGGSIYKDALHSEVITNDRVDLHIGVGADNVRYRAHLVRKRRQFHSDT
jgi:hypothetical protein